MKAYATLTSGTSAFVSNGASYSVSGGALSGAGAVRTLSVSSPGMVTVTVSASPDPDGVSDNRILTATASADSYTFEWALGLSSNTVNATFGSSVDTTVQLRYSSGYLETVATVDRPSLITFTSSDMATLPVGATGMLQPQQNSPNLSPLQVSAVMCDGQSVSHSDVYVNLRYSSPVDYDLGNSNGAALDYSAASDTLCIPISLYSASIVSQFQFVMRFDPELLACSTASCGEWRPGSAWSAFGDSVAYSPDSGQVDFATVASVSSALKLGLLDIGTLCLDVIGTGSLQLQVQMKVHIDSSETRNCSSGGHLYAMGARCYSRTSSLIFDVACSGPSCSRRQLLQSREGSQLDRRMDEVSGRAVPLNIDANGAQLTMSDCLYLTETQQVLTDKQAGTQSFIDSLPDSAQAISYNPNLDFYLGTSTPYISPSDAIYCINYVLKRWRFVYNVSLGCSPDGAVVSLELAGGKVGSSDQAEFHVEAPAIGTTVTAQVGVVCASSSTTKHLQLSAVGVSGSTSPFEGAFGSDADCQVSLQGFNVSLTNVGGIFETQFPWPDSVSFDRWLRPWDPGPASVTCPVTTALSPSFSPSSAAADMHVFPRVLCSAERTEILLNGALACGSCFATFILAGGDSCIGALNNTDIDGAQHSSSGSKLEQMGASAFAFHSTVSSLGEYKLCITSPSVIPSTDDDFHLVREVRVQTIECSSATPPTSVEPFAPPLLLPLSPPQAPPPSPLPPPPSPYVPPPLIPPPAIPMPLSPPAPPPAPPPQVLMAIVGSDSNASSIAYASASTPTRILFAGDLVLPTSEIRFVLQRSVDCTGADKLSTSGPVASHGGTVDNASTVTIWLPGGVDYTDVGTCTTA